MSGVDPQGCQVFSFQQPSAEELDHEFLWRTTRRLPERGRIGISNRSFYEEALIVRVHPELLRTQGFSEEMLAAKPIWKERYRSIVDLEAHLHRNGTHVVKFFFICRRTNNGSDSSRALMSLTRIGNSASQMFANGNIGSNTCRLTRNASPRRAPLTHPGMSCRLMTRKTHA